MPSVPVEDIGRGKQRTRGGRTDVVARCTHRAVLCLRFPGIFRCVEPLPKHVKGERCWSFSIRIGVKDSVGVQNGQHWPRERRAPLVPMESKGWHLWQLTVGWRPPRGGGGGGGGEG